MPIASCFSAAHLDPGRAGGVGVGEVLQVGLDDRADVPRGARGGAAARVHHLAPRGPHAQLRHRARRNQVAMTTEFWAMAGHRAG